MNSLREAVAYHGYTLSWSRISAGEGRGYKVVVYQNNIFPATFMRDSIHQTRMNKPRVVVYEGEPAKSLKEAARVALNHF